MLNIDCISDTHNRHKKIALPGGDILICSGDVSGRGESGEILSFLNWYADQDYSHIVLVPGNHDFGFERNPDLWAAHCKDRNIILLNDAGCEIEGIKVWGSPVQPWFHNWAFNRQRGEDIKKHWDLIPNDTEILITHGPPGMILDDCTPRSSYSRHVGCDDLYNKIIQTQVKLHVFGHIHESAGYKYKDGKTYVNAASLDGMYSYNPPGYVRVTRDESGTYLVEDTREERLE